MKKKIGLGSGRKLWLKGGIMASIWSPERLQMEDLHGQFPALSREDEGMPRVYLDNPAGTQVPASVIEAMNSTLLEANANLGGAFRTSRRAEEVVGEARRAMTDFLGAASPDEIVFGQNMTSLTFHLSRILGRRLREGDELIVTRMDHDANVAPWTLLARDLGLVMRWWTFDRDRYAFDLADLERLLGKRTRLVCASAASNLTGTLHDVAGVCRLAREAGALSYIDAVQVAPHVLADVQAMGCDFYVCSAYKFFGPHQGILWGREECLDELEPYKVRPAPERPPGSLETGTQSHESMAGTAAAVDHFAGMGATLRGREAHPADRRENLQAAMKAIAYYEQGLSLHLIKGLKRLRGVKIIGIEDSEAMSRRVPTVSFTVDGRRPAEIAASLAERNFFVWSGHNYALEPVRHLGLGKKRVASYASGWCTTTPWRNWIGSWKRLMKFCDIPAVIMIFFGMLS